MQWVLQDQWELVRQPLLALVLVAVITVQFSYWGTWDMDSATAGHAFLEKMGHKMNSEAVAGVSLERVMHF